VSSEFPEANVDPENYRAGFVLVKVALGVPLVFLGLDCWRGSADWFARSGAITLFILAFVQATLVSRLQTKHFRNAERASERRPILGLSASYGRLEKHVFWSGLYGTAVWAFGDKLVTLLVQ
jgi:hypothetical protein